MQPDPCPPGHEADVNGSVRCTAHDVVDFPLCFTDTAILYAVCVVMWVLAGVEFCFPPHIRPKIPINPLNISKLVSVTGTN